MKKKKEKDWYDYHWNDVMSRARLSICLLDEEERYYFDRAVEVFFLRRLNKHEDKEKK